MESYLLDGVMPGHILTPHLPENITTDLEIEALDAGDRLIDEERQRDRQFDALCEHGSQLWAWEDGFTAAHLRVGSYITVPKSAWQAEATGYITAIGEDRYDRPIVRVAASRTTERWAGEDVLISRWEERGRLLVPLPVDLAALGKYAPPTVHVAGMPTVTHTLRFEGAPHDDRGARTNGFGASGTGRAACACGELSDVLSTAAARKAWHRTHKEEMTR